MATGSITRLIRDRGFGFIRTDNGQEVFFHATGVPAGNFDALQEGQAAEARVINDEIHVGV